ncbi:MAG: hypothetical protein ABSG79_19030 [Bryobacteraceae bacterium]|jgi:hypothetical protein
MVSDEEFAALKKQVELLQTNFNIVAASHKNLVEVLFPQGMDTLTTFISSSGEFQTQFGEQLSKVMEGMGMLAKAVEAIQDELELRADLS